MPDKRRHMRAQAGFPARIIVGGQSADVTTKNLSMKGLLATSGSGFEAGAACEVRIRLAPKVEIAVEGRVVRADEEETAVDFVAMDDESFGMLHRLMQLNAPDADAIDEELRRPYFD
ncbi:MAG: PilZ domain-containing protein [Desulfovibrionaceae bacterium]